MLVVVTWHKHIIACLIIGTKSILIGLPCFWHNKPPILACHIAGIILELAMFLAAEKTLFFFHSKQAQYILCFYTAQCVCCVFG